MKKFLSLVLALVMTMSLVTVSAGAKDFTDNDELKYEEAVAVMSEVGIIGGYADGSFNPQGNLTRQAAAKIICNMILGPTTASALRADAASFKDVPVTNQFAGYIAYCAQQGIINGYADGTFRPTAPLTGYAFMKMLLGALGYDAQIEGYVGPNWSVQVAKRALGIGLNAGLKDSFNGVKTVNREEACLYAFNALQSTMVEYDSRTTVSVGGAEVVIAGSAAQDVAQNGYKDTMHKGNLQFAEKYFTKLSKDATTDVFGRPAHEWVYNKDSIGAFVDYTTFVDEFTTEVTGADLYNLLGASALKHSDVYVCIDGVDDDKVAGNKLFTEGYIAKNNKDGVGGTGNGVLTQVFYDKDNNEITIAIINTYLAKANADYNAKRDEVSFLVYGANVDSDDNVVKGATNDTIDVSGEDFAVEDVEEGDFFLFTMADGAVQSMAAPEMVEETTISSFKRDTSVKAEGETYEYADSIHYDTDVLDDYDLTNMKESTYNLFLDPYGYMIGIEKIAGEDSYVFITGYEAFSAMLSNAKTEARAIFTDGTVETITVKAAGNLSWNANGNSAINTWYSYSVDKNGNYSLTLVPVAASSGVTQQNSHDDYIGKTIDKAHPGLKLANGKFVQGGDETVYMAAKADTYSGHPQIVGVKNVTTGIKNVDVTLTKYNNNEYIKGAYALYKNGYIIAAVVVGENNAVASDYAFVTGTVSQEDWDAEAGTWTWYRTAIVNGEEVILREQGDTKGQLDKIDDTSMTQWDWYYVEYDADGYVVDQAPVTFVASPTAGDVTVDRVHTWNAMTAGKEDVVLISETMNTAWSTNHLYMQPNSNSLYVKSDGGYDRSVDVTADANAVLLTVKGSGYKVEYYNSVRGALGDLESNNFDGMVYFVMNEGLATTVVIVDNTPVNGFTPDAPVNNKLVINSMAYVTGANAFHANVTTKAALSGDETYTMTIETADGVKVVKHTQAWPYAVAADGTMTVGADYVTAHGTGDYVVTITFVEADGTVVASGSATVHVA